MAQQAKIAEYSGTEAISLAEAKSYLRVDYTNEDSYITELIKIARLQVLKDTNQVLVTTDVTEYYKDWPNDELFCLQYSGEITSPVLKYFNDNNVEVTLVNNTDYIISSHSGASKIQMLNTFNLYDRENAISFNYNVAPNNDDVVRTLKIAMYMLIQHYYDNRSPVSYLKVDELPLGYKHIINQYKNYIW